MQSSLDSFLGLPRARTLILFATSIRRLHQFSVALVSHLLHDGLIIPVSYGSTQAVRVIAASAELRMLLLHLGRPAVANSSDNPSGNGSATYADPYDRFQHERWQSLKIPGAEEPSKVPFIVRSSAADWFFKVFGPHFVAAGLVSQNASVFFGSKTKSMVLQLALTLPDTVYQSFAALFLDATDLDVGLFARPLLEHLATFYLRLLWRAHAKLPAETAAAPASVRLRAHLWSMQVGSTTTSTSSRSS